MKTKTNALYPRLLTARGLLGSGALLCAALIGGSLLGACSDRQADADYSDYIAETCEMACPAMYECSYVVDDEQLEFCLNNCIAESIRENQCGSRRAIFLRCVSTISCEEMDYYQNSLDQHEGVPGDFDCAFEVNAYVACSPDEPFDPNEWDE
ncbi:hypothetical protein G6O69_25665 [Pseudenhygromyxa sp. WMMC2535]|uniref:hypothetical protein n=1 Tax=Pseudenhygromyxa sp. WMMC2535 TaxID=2712867 RepID=UPI0015554C8E|nr:hypothetical protein [Pseudenhygromyxa sp. WMMC2535]NVB41253.1 hypothetical protein [Pseudenhygromyxa sp. WMMC2535]